MSDFKPAARRKARHMAMQALYQWHVGKAGAAEIEAQFLVDQNMEKVDKAYFHELLHSVTDNAAALDEVLVTALDRPVGDLTPVELAILRLGTYELQSRIDVPYRVVINEGVDMAKAFGATEGHRYVNGVLDKLARSLRQAERSG